MRRKPKELKGEPEHSRLLEESFGSLEVVSTADIKKREWQKKQLTDFREAKAPGS